ncbi:MAG: DNA internalization-related competence protein ComEC/Rec2 [Deltaproteobacteria bacterium]|nr:DNA internalization-related competence protein ComEC/Rec2 [Deltaproteobacteria bacterium]
MNPHSIIPILISFILGIFSAEYNLIGEETAFSIFIAALLLAILLLLKKIFSYPAIYSAFFFAGILLMIQETNPVFPPNHIKNIINNKKELMNIEGVLCRSPERFIDRTRLYVNAEKMFNNDAVIPITGKILLTVDGQLNAPLKYGDRIRFISKIHTSRNFGNPGEFDYKWHLEKEGIYAKGYIENERWIVKISGHSQNPFWANIEKIRKGLNDLIDKTASDNKGIMKALLIGESGEIPKNIKDIFAKTGTSHILAISGLHIGIVAFVIYSLFYKILIQSEKLTLSFNIKKLAAIASILPILFYGLIAGFPVSTERAVIMVIVFILAVIIDREKDFYNTLAIAGFIILVISPSAIYNISFQLSFASVFAIIYLMPKFQSIYAPSPQSSPLAEEGRSEGHVQTWFKDKIITGLLVSIVASIGTAPIVAYHFHRVSIIGILANVIAVPLMGFIVVPLELLASFIHMFSGGLASFILQTASLVLKISVWVIDIFSKLPYSSIWVTTPTIFEIIIFYLLVISLVSIKKFRIAKYAAALLIIALISDYAYRHYRINYNENLKVTFLSIGQGDSSLVEFPHGKRMLIDGGGSQGADFDTGERLIAPFLWKNKIKNIDYIVMSHPQSDHFKGLKFIAENFNVKEFWWNGDNAESEEYKDLIRTIEMKNIKKRIIDTSAIDINGVKLESLNQLKSDIDKNNASLVMKITYGDIKFLFTGDIEKQGEMGLIKDGRDIKADVLKVPHHGSRTSSTDDFIKSVSPKIAVMSVGYANQFHFPHKDIVGRYEKAGVRIMRTDLMGAITIETNGKEKIIKSYLQNTIASP